MADASWFMHASHCIHGEKRKITIIGELDGANGSESFI